MRRDKKVGHREGFTLVEWLIVILALAALALIVIPRLSTSATNANINACKANVDLINSQIELYKVKTDNWPAALTDVTQNTDCFRDSEPECPFGTPYTMGANNRATEHSH